MAFKLLSTLAIKLFDTGAKLVQAATTTVTQ